MSENRGRFRNRKKILALIAVSLVLAAAGGAFLFRSPALIVSDAPFAQLYGSRRLRLRQIKLSLELFRRVLSVEIAESAGSDLAVLAVEGAARSPAAVLFPYRYLEEAAIYQERHPDARVFAIGGRNPRPREETAYTFIGTDTATDLYRAGLCAAALAGEGEGVLFFGEPNPPEAHRAAFMRGLEDGAFGGTPVFLGAAEEYASYDGIGCVVVAGPAQKFLEQNREIPTVLFSWADPDLSPGAVKLVFDDSPWAFAGDAVKAVFPPGEAPLIPSAPLAIEKRMEKKDFRIIRGLIKANFEKK